MAKFNDTFLKACRGEKTEHVPVWFMRQAGRSQPEYLKIKEKYANERVSDIDGVKIDFENSWVHLRKSNTEAIIRIYAEAKSKDEAHNLAIRIINEILQWAVTKKRVKNLLLKLIAIETCPDTHFLSVFDN